MNKLKNILKKAINTSLIGIAASMFMPIASYAEDFGDYGIEYYSDVVVYPGYHVVIEAAPFSSRYGKTAPKVGMGWVESDKIDQEEVWNTGDTDHWSNGYGMNSVGSVGDSESKDYYYLRPKSGEPGSDFPYSKFSNEGKYLLFSSPMWWSEENQTEGMVDAYFLFKGIKGESNRKSFIVAALQDYDQGRIEWYDAEAYNFVTESGSPKIYPDSYEDYIVLTPSEIESVIPWMNYYIDQETGEYRSISMDEREEIFNKYKGSKYFNQDWVEEMLGVDALRRDIEEPRDIYPSMQKIFQQTIKLRDLIDTKTLKKHVAKKYTDDGDSYLNDYAIYDYYLTSNWFISSDNITYYPLGSSKSAGLYDPDSGEWVEILGDEFIYDEYSKTIKLPVNITYRDGIEYETYNVSDYIGDGNTFYMKRQSSATGILSTYNNVMSPPRKVRPTLTIDKIEAVYTGNPVTQGLYADPADIEIRVWYSDRVDDNDFYTYNGNQPFVTLDGLEIYNVGNNNLCTWTLVDPRLGEVRTGDLFIPGKEPDPVSISATYQGDPVVEETAFNPSQVRVQITYNNGDIFTYSGSSLSVGITTSNKYNKSDVDLNTVVNQNDLKYIEMALKGTTLTSQQRTQADTNSDGKVDNKDYDYVEKLISRVVPLGDKIFYASYANLYGSDNKLQYASFKVTAERKKPYKLVVATKPLKMNYIEGEDFDPTGMILNVYYNNGTMNTFTFSSKDDQIDGITIGSRDYPSKNMKSDQTIMPITYTENGETVETELNLKVTLKTLTSIKITNPPETLIYYSGENFDRTGMEVTAYYDEFEQNHQSTSSILNDRDYEVENDRRLKDSRNYIVIEADDPSDVDTGFLRIMKSDVVSPQTFDNGTHATFRYKSGGSEKTLKGTIVGNNFVTVLYTERGVTKKAYQPIDVLQRKLVAIEVEQMPYKTTYIAGDSFDSTGLIIKASYTDGTSEYIYEKTADRNGYEVVNPDNLTTERKEVVVQYTENGFTRETTVPITVNDPSLESIKAVYMGPNVYLNSDFDPHDVIITATYTNHVDAFRGDDKNDDGTSKFTFRNEAGVVSINVSKLGENKFTVEFGGKTAEFIVTGIKRPDQIDFSGSVAKSKRKWSTWTEEFKAIKIQSVADYINGKVNDLPIDTITTDEYHVVEKTNVTEDRTVLIEYNGTAKIPDFSDPNKVVSPLLSFMREGTWRQPETEIRVQYRTRTKGYLFPETPNAMWAADESYLNAYQQDRDQVWAGNQGWSDWYYDGDSSGTVNGDRIAYAYDLDTNPSTDTHTMVIDALQIKLDGVRNGDNPGLNVTVQDVNGNTQTYNGVNENVTIASPAKIKINLTGQITVTDNNSQNVKRNFNDVYKIYYRSTTDELTQWSETGEWAGVDGVGMQNLEIRLLLKESNFDKGSTSDRPIFSQHPKNTSAVIGDRVIFTVSAVGQTLTYQWYSDKGGTDAPISGATSSSYRTPELTSSDNGVHYWCVVSNGLTSTASSKALLTVNDIFPIITRNPEDVTATVGTVASFSVEATCKEPSTMHYTWQIRNGSTWELLPGTVDSPNINVQLTADMHGKDIRCKVENSRGYTYSNSARINCSRPPEVEVKSATEYAVVGRQTLKISANILASSGGESYTWIVDDVKQAASSATFSYQPKEVGDHDITCVVTDKFGSGQDTLTIHVGEAPKIELSQKTENASDGTKSVTIKTDVKTSGNGGTMLYEWRLDGQLLEGVKGTEYKLTGLKPGDQHTLTCTVQNNFGLATGIANIIIK